MSRRVLIVCYEIPTQGGTATSAHALFAKLRRDGVDAHCLYLVERAVVPYYAWAYGRDFANPGRDPRVHTCVVEHPLYRTHATLTAAIERIAPGVILTRGYIATVLTRLAAPTRPVVFMTAGSRQAEFLIEQGRVAQAADLAAALPRTGRLPAAAPGREGAAFDAADLILPGSELVGDVIRGFFHPDRACKVADQPLWSAEWIVESVTASGVRPKPFAERSIDVLFCATNWARPEKNLPAVRGVMRQLADLRGVIVGDCRDPVPGVRHTGRITDRAALFRLMADARVLASPSLVDACPATLFEGAELGCNIVTTKNCGNWRLCSPELLVDPPSEAGLATAIRRGITHSYPSDLDWFLRTRSYARLVEILQALAA